MLRFACFIVLVLQATGNAQLVSDATSTQVPLPLAVKKFIAIDKAEEFTFGTIGGNMALATATEEGQVGVVIPSAYSGGGKLFRTNLELENTPRLLLADLNGDKQAELLVGSKQLIVYGLGQNGLRRLWDSAEVFGDEPPPRLAVADFDGDGDSDIIVLNYKHRDKEPDSQSVYVYLNQARDAFSFRLSGTLTLTDVHGFHSASGLTVGAFYGGDRPQIVVGNSNGWLWLIEVNHERPVVASSWEVPSGGAIGPGLAVGNLDGGDENELLVGTNGGDIFVYRPIRSAAAELVATAHAGRLAYGVQSADLDGDGHDDFLLSRGYLGYAGMTQKDVVTECWQLKGRKLRRIWQRRSLGFISSRILPRDFDGDNIVDLAIYGPSENGPKIEVIKPKLDTLRMP